jgi:DNA-binding NtrC family response regulator
MVDGRPTILIVDDDAAVTMSLRDLLLVQADYRIVTHTSVREALSAAGSFTVDLVISDYLMPEMDGITFLSRFKEIQPQTVQVLLAGNAERGKAIRAIRSADLYDCLEKPWDNDHLVTVVRNGIEKRFLLRALEIKTAELDRANSNLKSIRAELIKAFM